MDWKLRLSFLRVTISVSQGESQSTRMLRKNVWRHGTEESSPVSVFRTNSWCQAVRCLLELTTESILQPGYSQDILRPGPVSFPVPPSIVSSLPSILQPPSPTASPESSRHKSKASARAEVPRGGVWGEEGQNKWTQQMQFAFLGSFFWRGGSFALFFGGSFLHQNDLHHIFLPSF